jgi:hypothetical protein
MSRLFLIASAVAVAATSLVVGAAGPAFASSTPTPTPAPKSSTAAKTPKTLAQVQAAVAAGPSKRTTALDKAAADVTKNTYQTLSDKAKLQSVCGRKKDDLYFSNYSENTAAPENVGIYALGVAPFTHDPRTASGNPKALLAWENTGASGV